MTAEDGAPPRPDDAESSRSAFEPRPPRELAASAFSLELSSGRFLEQGLGLADLAHVLHLEEVGVVPRPAAAELVAALLTDRDEPGTAPDADLGDLYTNRLHRLRRLAGSSAGWLSAGRPRREATTLAYFLAVRSGLLAVLEALGEAREALLRLADDHVETEMPDFTYLQPAHPTTFAHYLLTYAPPLARDVDRLSLVYRHHQDSPAGAGSTNGSRLPLDRRRLANSLGFHGVLGHTRDAMWPADLAVEVLSALAGLLTTVGRLAEDLFFFASAEVGFLQLGDAHSRRSVIMPQKKNPYALAYLRGAAREVIGQWTATVAHQATPSGQVDNRIFAYRDVPAALASAERSLRLLAGLLGELEIDAGAMARGAARSSLGATDLAERLMLEQGLDWESSHEVVSLAVRKGGELEIGALRAAADELGLEIDIAPDLLEDCTEPARLIATRTGLGGAARSAVEALLDAQRADLLATRHWVRGERRHHREAESSLLTRAHDLCRST